MIITIFNSERNDQEEIKINSQYLQNSINHKITAWDEIIKSNRTHSTIDNSESLYIVSHGNPKKIGGMNAQNFAKTIGSYINNAKKWLLYQGNSSCIL